jgi:hypothetical protein
MLRSKRRGFEILPKTPTQCDDGRELCPRLALLSQWNRLNSEDCSMNRKLIALAFALVAAPAVGHAQQRDTVKRDTVKKESTAEKVGRQTGTSVDKAAKTTEHNAKTAGHATKVNASHAASATKTNASHAASATTTNASHAASATKTNASHAASATKTNLHHLKKDVKKAVGDTTKPAKP